MRLQYISATKKGTRATASLEGAELFGPPKNRSITPMPNIQSRC